MATTLMTCEPRLGENIWNACERAVAIAQKHNCPVTLTFNGIRLVVEPGDTAGAVYAAWREQVQAEPEAWRGIAVYQRAMREVEAERQAAQAATDALIVTILERLGTLESTVAWCIELTKAANYAGIRWEPALVADALEMAGYAKDAHVGKPVEAFKGDQRAAGEYIVGQVIDCLRSGMPPHPMIVLLAEQAGFVEPPS